MDPDETYYLMYTAMHDGLITRARYHALNLQEWLDMGGFWPVKYSRVEVKQYLFSVLRRTSNLHQTPNELHHSPLRQQTRETRQ